MIFFFIIINNFTGFSSQINYKKRISDANRQKTDFGFLIYATKNIEDKEITFFNVLLLKYYKKKNIKINK